MIWQKLDWTKAKLRQPNQQESSKKANSPQFKHRRLWLVRFKKILTSISPTFARLYGRLRNSACTSIFIAYSESGNIKDLCLNTMTKHG